MQVQSNGEFSPNPNSPLIKVEKNANGEQAVSARELHKFLEVETDFTDWCKRMFEYGFVENQDFNLLKFEEVRFEGKREVRRMITDYALTLDTAKEIAMLQRSEKGKQARQYFIDCEKQLKNANANLSPFDVMQNMLNQLKEQERLNLEQSKKLTKIEQDVNELQAQGNHSVEHFTIIGWYKLNKWKYNLTNTEVQQMGKELTRISKALNFVKIDVPNMHHGTIGSYHKDLLKMFFDARNSGKLVA